MKLNIKQLCIYSLLLVGGAGLTSCEDFLDRQPQSNVTPESYFAMSSQVGAYVNNYYNGYLLNSRGQSLYHSTGWNSGIANNDADTYLFVDGEANLS